MDQQIYWRNIIANEIKAEHDRVKKYYSQRSANSGGISSEEQTRLNIFLLCQSIASTYKDHNVIEDVVEEVIQAQPVEIISEPIPTPKPATPSKPAPKPRVKKKPPTFPGQNEFGEII